MMVTIEKIPGVSPDGSTGWWNVTIDPAVDDDDLAEAMIALFGKVAERPNMNLLQFQMKMMRAVQSQGEGASAPPDDPPG